MLVAIGGLLFWYFLGSLVGWFWDHGFSFGISILFALIILGIVGWVLEGIYYILFHKDE